MLGTPHFCRPWQAGPVHEWPPIGKEKPQEEVAGLGTPHFCRPWQAGPVYEWA